MCKEDNGRRRLASTVNTGSGNLCRLAGSLELRMSRASCKCTYMHKVLQFRNSAVALQFRNSVTILQDANASADRGGVGGGGASRTRGRGLA